MFPITLEKLSYQERHDYILKTYILNAKYSEQICKQKRDIDIIRSNHRFLWDDDEDVSGDLWELRLARRYYDKLFREYCIADLSRFKENKVALRWRIEAEVVSGKGQFQCGSRHCEEREDLRTWEVNFAYLEKKERKNALVKVRLCPEHSKQLNYTSRKREIKRLKRAERQKSKSSKSEINNTKASQKDLAETESTKVESICENSSNVDKSTTTDTTEVANEEPSAEEDIWSKKSELELEPNSRETDFERYLEDLLL